MEALKRNKLLVVVMVVAIAISAFLLYLVFDVHQEMNDSAAQVDAIKNKIHDLIKVKPAPSKENLEKLNVDKDKLKDKLKEIRSIFGHPYRKALQKFAAALGLNEYSMLEEFHTFWKNEVRKAKVEQRDYDQYELLSKYLDKLKSKDNLSEKKIIAAFKIFQDVVKKETVEPIKELTDEDVFKDNEKSNIKDIFLEAMGVQRTMTGAKCKSFIRTMQEGYIDLLLPRGKDGKIRDGELNKNIVKFSFDAIESKMPSPDEIPLLVMHAYMINDLLKRMNAAGLEKLQAIRKTSGLRGEEVRGYLKLNYQIEVKGSQRKVKAFLNSLQDAYKDSKVYIIRDLMLEKNFDGMQTVKEYSLEQQMLAWAREEQEDAKIAMAKKQKSAAIKARKDSKKLKKGHNLFPPDMDMPNMKHGGHPGMKADIDLEELAAELKKPAEDRRDYGVPLIGSSKQITAVIDFQYVIYVKNQLRLFE
jgi:hypothetical protein